MKQEVKAGMTDYSAFVYIPDPASTDGSGKTGLVAANLTVSFARMETDNDATITDATSSLNNLATLTSAHADWGVLEVSNTLAPGLYRIDFADAVFATGAWSAVVYVMITTSAAAASPMEFVLVPQSPVDGVLLAPTTHTSAVIPTVTTVTNQLTAAAIATGIWQDATAGDFTTASSIGKALYIANVAPGGSGGHLISGSNAGTTTLGALTITGATTFTGAVTGTSVSNDLRINGKVPGFADGLLIAGLNSATVEFTDFTVTDDLVVGGTFQIPDLQVGNGVVDLTNIYTSGSIQADGGIIANITGNITGNLSGTIGGLTAGALKDFFDTDSATTYASAVAGSVVKEIVDNSGGTPPTAAAIADAVWDEDATGHQTGGTFGQAIGDPGADTNTIFKAVVTDASGATVGADSTAILADTNELQTDWTNGGRLDLLVDSIISELAKVPKSDSTVSFNATALAAIADALLDRNMATGTDSGSTTVRTPRQALRMLRNKWSISGSTLTVTKEDDSTTSHTAALTGTAGADPITAVDPAGP